MPDTPPRSLRYRAEIPAATGLKANYRDRRSRTHSFALSPPDSYPRFGARLREGRFFTDDDRASTLPVVIVNETFADRHWPGQSAIGKRMCTLCPNPRATRPPIWMTVVGVVHEIRERGLETPVKQGMYTPLAQSGNYWPTPVDLVIRASVPPETIASAAQQAIWSVDKDQPLARIRTMRDVAELELAPPRQQMILLGVFAALALVLAAVGLYGVLSYAVARRIREIGVRMSLGATPSGIVKLILERGLLLTVIGVLIGIGGAVLAGRAMTKILFESKGSDPGTLATVSLILLSVAVFACLVPALRASRVDPAIALRNE